MKSSQQWKAFVCAFFFIACVARSAQDPVHLHSYPSAAIKHGTRYYRARDLSKLGCPVSCSACSCRCWPAPKRMRGRWKGALSKAEARALQLDLQQARPYAQYYTRWKTFCRCTRVKACTWPGTSKHGARCHHVQKSREVIFVLSRQVFCILTPCAVKEYEWRPQQARVESNLF